VSPRATSVYRCQECGFASPKPGTCPDCLRGGGAYVQLVEERSEARTASRRPGAPSSSRPQPLKDVVLEAGDRVPTGIGELDRVLGGGVVRGSLVLLGGEPGCGKCVTGDTRVFDPETGDYLPITALRDRRASVLSINENSLLLHPSSVQVFHERGIRPVIDVTTRLGRRLRCTPDHPLLTEKGWREAGRLTCGARIASARALPYFGQEAMSPEAIKLIAYILSDGSAQSAIDVTSALPGVEEDLKAIADAFEMRLVAYDKPGNAARQYRFVTRHDANDRVSARRELATTLHATRRALGISWQEWARRSGVSFALLNVWRRAEAVPSRGALKRLAMAASVALDDLAPAARDRAAARTPIADFLESHGVRFTRAASKRVPAAIFRLPRETMVVFLRTLFSCDGSVYVNRAGVPGVSYSTISERLAADVQHLLLRFGLVTRLRTKHQVVNGKPYRAYELQMFGPAAVTAFLDEIGIIGREKACDTIREMPPATTPSTGMDTVPTGGAFWARVRRAAEPLTFAGLRRESGVIILNRRHDRPLCRRTVAALTHTLRDPMLEALGLGDVWWDEVVDVRPAGEAPVFDLTVAGEPSFVANDLIIHNSTLLLQAARALGKTRPPVLYVSAEESAAQVKMRADRLGIAGDGLLLWAETDLIAVQAALDDVKPQALIVDSIQTVFLPDLESAPGSVAQVRECAARLMTQAKGRGLATFLVGHVTKDGAIAGPRVLEHLVDTVLYFEGEQHHAYRVLRAVKNRFGSTNEIGVFEMAERGLVEVSNPSGFFLSERPVDAPGSAVVASLEGTRPMLLELQALVARASFGTPRRTVLGADYNRVCLLLAVLEKRAQLPIGNQDVFVNVAGGGRVVEPAADLAIVLAAASSYMERPLPADVVVLGEVGLTGEVRAVAGLESRLRCAAQLGFRAALVPKSGAAELRSAPLRVRGVTTVTEALEALLP